MICLNKFNTSLDYSHPNAFLVSQWQKDKTSIHKHFLIYRWILAVYFNFVVILSLITAELDKNFILYPIFLTNWNVLLNGLSSLLMALIVTQHFRKRQANDHDDSQMTSTLKVSWLISTLSLVIATSISIIYWPLIYTGRDKGLNDALTHAGNAIILFIDSMVSAYPPRFGHFVYQLGFALTYLAFDIIYTFSGGYNRDHLPFIYNVLDWKSKPIDALIFSLITLGFLVLIHFILTGFMVLRIRVYVKYFKTKHEEELKITGSNNQGYEV